VNTDIILTAEGAEIQLKLDADFAGYADLLAGLGALGLAGLDVNIRQSQYLRPQAIFTNGRQKLCKPAPTVWSHTKGLSEGQKKVDGSSA